MELKTPELKLISIKRWVTTTPFGIELPEGAYLSIKRKEVFVSTPKPHFKKTEFMLFMFPYGNVWSQREPDTPIDEEWVWTKVRKKLIFERLMEKDAAYPVKNYFKMSYDYMVKNPDQIGIHLKRKKNKLTKRS